MSLLLQKASDFVTDFELQYRYYAFEAGLHVANAYLEAVHETLELLAAFPGLGRRRRLRHPKLRGLRSFRVNPPFNHHLIFYRHDATTLSAERIMHGARDLPRRLRERPSGSHDPEG